MIIGKTNDGYICKHNNVVFEIPKKEIYLIEKQSVLEIKEPTDEELIKYAKERHPFYNKNRDVQNLDNQIKEIDEYEENLSKNEEKINGMEKK